MGNGPQLTADRVRQEMRVAPEHGNTLPAQEEARAVAGQDVAVKAPTANLAQQSENLTEQMLADYYAKPQADKDDGPARERRWPLYALRKAVGCAQLGLHEAVLDGDAYVVRATALRLGRRNAKLVNERDADGRTALSLAVKIGDENVAVQLIGLPKVDLDAADATTGLTPLHHAVQLNLSRVTSHLCKAGAAADRADAAGMTPLMLACRLGHQDMQAILVETGGASLHARDAAGWTALHYAAYHGEGECADYLLHRGADAAARDARGLAPLDWADAMGYGDVAAYLESYARAAQGRL
ncbi:ankyrin repeat-containing domain protein [Tribonema minus]|uniref:Ankyrin repeat-containing domain protein n=1 Tax=Tribonema minus TaxID=303371 RepID=A0A835YPM3_9STRA|nr:ankyrin repeat-containing domain protein [Tribonema minus]